MHVVIMTRYQNRNTGLGEVQLCPYRTIPFTIKTHNILHCVIIYITKTKKKKKTKYTHDTVVCRLPLNSNLK